MNKIERGILWLSLGMMALYIALYLFTFIPPFQGQESAISKAATEPLGWLTLTLVLVAIILSLRDLYYRNISGKAGWVVGIMFFTWLGLPYYFIKHARKQRYDTQQVADVH